MTDCIMCHEPLTDTKQIHRECGLRTAVGGIGHLLDHQHFCKDVGDTDAGLDLRTSALLVDVWITRKGIESIT